MADGEVIIEGAARLRRTLRAAGDDLSDLRRAHRDAAGIAAEASAQLVKSRTGRLAATVRAAGTKTAGIIRAGNNTRVLYAGPIHWGWHRRHIKANPFLSRGAKNSEGRWIRVYENAVDNALDKIEGI
jgi:hypothetical protein